MSRTKDYQLELCIDSLESAIGAEKHGADRVELCSHLDQDGLTPSDDLLRSVCDAVTIGVYVMIRPRDIDFVYSASEINQMITDIERVKDLGADGIVSGVLLPDGRIDKEATAKLIEASRPLPFTFHRAFDYCVEPLSSCEALDALGVERLLTSGQEDKAFEGLDLIKSLCNINSRIQVMAGSGVNAEVIPALWEAGVRQFHFTSHLMDSGGVNRFDPEKVTRAHETLERLSLQEKSIPDS